MSGVSAAAALGELSGLLGVEVVGVDRAEGGWLVSVRVPEHACPRHGVRHPTRVASRLLAGADLRNPRRLAGWAGASACPLLGPGRDPGLPALTAADGRLAVAWMHKIVEFEGAVG